MSINTYLKNAALSEGLNPVVTNTPAQYADRQRQYFDAETRRFTRDYAKYSSDFVEARVQGLWDDDPQEWGTYRIRLADVVRPTAAIQRYFDDYKMVLFESPTIEYIRQGTKIETMGSTWLAVNPVNVSGSSGSGIVRRCNAVWNFYDEDGNIVSEPIIVENERANANDGDVQQSQFITKGYFNVTCQYNDYTRQIDTNTRLILGTAAYRVTGYSDFETEFTGDYSTVRLLKFSVRYEEANDAIDDMVNHIAGGKVVQAEASNEQEPSEVTDGVGFTTPYPLTMGYGDTVTLKAAYFVSGEQTSDTVTWSFAGADDTAYRASHSGNEATIACYGYSDSPLVVTASYGAYSASVTIGLTSV